MRDRAPDLDAGFATATAMVFCAGLAVVSVALLDMGNGARRRADAHIEQEQERQALSSAIAERAAGLANGDALGLGSSTTQIGRLSVEVEVKNELAKTNVYLASSDQLAATLVKVGLDSTSAAIARHASEGRDGHVGQPLDKILGDPNLTEHQKTCARQVLTVHASSVDPFLTGSATPTARGGGIVSIRARIVEGRPLDLTHEQIVLITGRLDQPLQVLEDRIYRSSEQEKCK